jgi:hypothetical protein
MQAVKAFFQGTTEENYQHPLRVADAITYMGDLNQAFISDNTCKFPAPVDEFGFAANYEYMPPEVDKKEEPKPAPPVAQSPAQTGAGEAGVQFVAPAANTTAPTGRR